jgi:uncharacterized protein (TIGR02246 family)
MHRTIAAAFMAAMAAAPASAQTAAASPLALPSVEWAHRWQSKDLDAVLALYTNDAVFVNADGSRVTGKPALRKFFASVLAQYSAQPSLRSVNNASSGDLGYDWGDYTEIVTPVAKPKRPIRTGGTYLVILRRVLGRWLIAEQMWTGSTPVPVWR